jgi:hypothetical protein
MAATLGILIVQNLRKIPMHAGSRRSQDFFEGRNQTRSRSEKCGAAQTVMNERIAM